LKEFGGSLCIESDAGHSCSIIATIPVAPSQQPEAETATSGQIDLSQGPIDRVGRILIIDDHEVIRRGVEALLEGKPDLMICGEASTVEEAMDLLERLRPDIALLDLRLGDESGWNVAQKVRKERLATRVIVFSQYDQRASSFTAKAAGCHGFVSK